MCVIMKGSYSLYFLSIRTSTVLYFFINFCSYGRWIIPITVKQDNFIFRVHIIIDQFINMCDNPIEVVLTTVYNSFYDYTTIYSFLPFTPNLSVKFVTAYKVCVPFIHTLMRAFRQTSQIYYSSTWCSNT